MVVWVILEECQLILFEERRREEEEEEEEEGTQSKDRRKGRGSKLTKRHMLVT
jgi:hypothetical protein